MVTVSGNPNPTYPTNPTNPTNPTTKYRCEFVNLNCIYTQNGIGMSTLVPWNCIFWHKSSTGITILTMVTRLQRLVS